MVLPDGMELSSGTKSILTVEQTLNFSTYFLHLGQAILSQEKSGYFAVCFSIFIWGITFVCTKHLLHYFSALEILFIRFVMAYLMLSIMYPHKLKITKTDMILPCGVYGRWESNGN